MDFFKTFFTIIKAAIPVGICVLAIFIVACQWY